MFAMECILEPLNSAADDTARAKAAFEPGSALLEFNGVSPEMGNDQYLWGFLKKQGFCGCWQCHQELGSFFHGCGEGDLALMRLHNGLGKPQANTHSGVFVRT